MKKIKKLEIKKVTLLDLDGPALEAVAGGNLVGPHSVVGQSGCLACQTPACATGTCASCVCPGK
jgi:hypothetical protein